MKSVSTPGKPRTYSLTNPFTESLRTALTGGGDHKSFGVPCKTPESKRVSIAQLDAYAQRQWEAVLGFMVGSAEGANMSNNSAVSEGVKQLLKDGEFVRGRPPKITKEGFAFILQEVNSQVWTILIYYLEGAEKVSELWRGRKHTEASLTSYKMRMDPVDVLSFLFMLGSLELGQDYSKATLSPTQVHMLEDLSDFGLIYLTSLNSSRFYPTRLATTLTSDAGALRNSPTGLQTALHSSAGGVEDSGGEGFIVIETNYRIYAYTRSPLQIAILQLFTKLSVRFPNMVHGKVTRESIRRAVNMGITSDQIISYLQTHAHPQMRKENINVLPATVVDQIRLWQIEGERMQTTTGFLMKDFASSNEYETTVKYAEEIGVLKWRNDTKRIFFVHSIDQIQVYLKNKPKR